ncbi:MAG: hypothetical protein AMJ42_04590 [Deltaproteobacteria bacterium DG_8]|nr:MAG: hypothetical protein AMJ42_04590 [Deltaproteobacteria bacterium DG_8]
METYPDRLQRPKFFSSKISYSFFQRSYQGQPPYHPMIFSLTYKQFPLDCYHSKRKRSPIHSIVTKASGEGAPCLKYKGK